MAMAPAALVMPRPRPALVARGALSARAAHPRAALDQTSAARQERARRLAGTRAVVAMRARLRRAGQAPSGARVVRGTVARRALGSVRQAWVARQGQRRVVPPARRAATAWQAATVNSA